MAENITTENKVAPAAQTPKAQAIAGATQERRAASSAPSGLASLVDKAKDVQQKAAKKAGLDPKVILGIAVAAVVVIILLIVLLANVFSGTYVKGDIKAISLYQTKTTKDIANLEPVNSFKVGDPIILKFDYDTSGSATDTSTYTYQVTSDVKDDQGQPTVIRKGSIPVQASDGVQSRYISIVSSERTAIAAGNYAFELLQTPLVEPAVDGTEAEPAKSEVIARTQFKVSE
ncbi:hypothetical protein FACS1894125_0510 [Actinomycetota bacterium]|nr:hypothetical protein FACS1894125_0510 [Actinomycetota bacterium]